MEDAIVCKFSVLCDKKWDAMKEIEGNVDVRFCSFCQSPVYMSRTYEDLAENIAAKRCVAIRAISLAGNIPAYTGLMYDSEDDESIRDLVLDPILMRSVNELVPNPQASSKLNRYGACLVGDLIQLSREDLLTKIPLSKSELKDVVDALASLGLDLGMKIENWVKSSPNSRSNFLE